jgi:hypothetical protein
MSEGISSADCAEAAEEITSYEIDSDQVKDLDACDKHIQFLKNEVARRALMLDVTEQAKKDVMAGWRDTIKAQKENLKDSMDRLRNMEDRKRVLAAGNANTDEE